MDFGDYVKISCIFAFIWRWVSWIYSNHMKTLALQAAALHHTHLRAYAFLVVGFICAPTVSMRKEMMIWIHTADTLLIHTTKRCITMEWRIDATDLPDRLNRTAWISALPTLHLRKVKENPAVDAISPLTLFLICLQALICFSDVARAPPPPRLWPNV